MVEVESITLTNRVISGIKTKGGVSKSEFFKGIELIIKTDSEKIEFHKAPISFVGKTQKATFEKSNNRYYLHISNGDLPDGNFNFDPELSNEYQRIAYFND